MDDPAGGLPLPSTAVPYLGVPHHSHAWRAAHVAGHRKAPWRGGEHRQRQSGREPHYVPLASAVHRGTKGAVDANTGALARELGPRTISVNSINPGVVATKGAHNGGHIGS